MTILVVGGGGREHALIHTIKRDNPKAALHCAPGNGGIASLAQCHAVRADDIAGMIALAKQIRADLVIVTPDDPLVLGMVDALEKEGLRAFGPSKAAAQLEGSKVFSKNLMKKYGIPTAAYEAFENPEAALEYIKSKNTYPTVIKADGLALGKGVIIAADYAEAQKAVEEIMVGGKFGASGKKIVVEEFLSGPEVSVLSFTDGKTIIPMVSAMDHKRAGDGDTGLNTGGMGTVSPNPAYTPEIAKKCMERIFLPTVSAMNSEGRPFKGVIFFGLMICGNEPYVIEYNARLGDPEAQVVLPRLKSNLLEIIDAVIDGRLCDIRIEWSDKSAACVVLASGGYPQSYQKGYEIKIDPEKTKHALLFHAGTECKGEMLVTSGGRVLGVAAVGKDLAEALEKAYSAAEGVSFKDKYFRTDIGKKALYFKKTYSLKDNALK